MKSEGDEAISSPKFVKDHEVVFWNLIVYFKVMKLPYFILD